MHYQPEVEYVVCPHCNFATPYHSSLRYCPQCGGLLHTGFETNSHYNGAGSHQGHWEPPRPGQPGFEEYWSHQRVEDDDFGSGLGAILVLGLAAVGTLAIINSLKNDKKRLEGD
jgi:hypothetical protein